MPEIDLSWVALDSYLAGEAFQVERRVQTVNSYGEVGITTTVLDGIGGISPTGSNSMVREDAFQSKSKTIRVITTFPLRGPSIASGQDFQPDIVLWAGDRYVVVSINDYTHYGVGFVEAECTNMNFTEQATATS
jgi:hypothetical protein